MVKKSEDTKKKAVSKNEEKSDSRSEKKSVNSNDKTLGIIVHILGIFTGFIGALVIYLIAEDSFTKKQAGDALNWQLSLLIYVIVSTILVILLIGILLLVVLSIMNLIVCIVAAVKASNGEYWDYPLAIRFFK